MITQPSFRFDNVSFARTVTSFALLALSACGSSGEVKVHDPKTSPAVAVDRFSTQAGMLQIRSGSHGLPTANAPIDFDQGPFITEGLGPIRQIVKHYNFGVKPQTPAPTYSL